MQDLAFALLSALAVATSLLVVTRKNPVYALLYLMGFFLSLTGLFVLLAAPFVAAIQVIVYVGAILVLFLFVLMLLDYTEFGGETGRSLASFVPALVVSAGLAIGLTAVLVKGARGLGSPEVLADPDYGSIVPVARHLYERYGLALELVSVLVLAALVGSVVVARRQARTRARAATGPIEAVPARPAAERVDAT